MTGQLREANGRISRAKLPREAANQLAIEMRAKRFGLTLQEAKNPLAGTYIGRLCLQGVITQEQYDAAQQYLQIRNNYLCAKGFPNAIYDEMPSSADDKARDKWVAFATERFINMQEALREAQCLYKQYNLYAALQYLVIEDQMLPYLVNSLRAALNVLHRYWK
ncbi:hypothetical protein [Bartonella rattimassiliensis]|uniref:Uncharacterized protein n=1 Tax=Bartonella rattimassiliensis 15908 TaxID=1094556 RepID=J1JKW2_9HYPH|nr:hypothetical protein [Bartonella rattimassiliensis]EJF85317.1 hypothetical protein MCY_01158 [Bartonella rattimassiliensis 15908]